MKLEKRMKVVFADDSEIHHFYLSNQLSAYSNLELVYQAKNGRDLLLFLCEFEQEVDIAIIDLHMPYLDGIRTAKRLRRFYPKMRIYGFTSSSDEQERETLLKAGVCKVYAKHELMQLLKEISCQ